MDDPEPQRGEKIAKLKRSQAECKTEKSALKSICKAGFLFGAKTVFGFLFTVLAIMMGSNFWFDSLRNLMNLRGVGRRPDSEDKKK